MRNLLNKLRVGIIAPLVESIPPKTYGGTERVVHTLSEELVALGHDVTLFAAGDSLTSARLVPVSPKALREMDIYDVQELYAVNPHSLLNIGLAYSRHAEFDILHDHYGVISLPTANIVPTPVISTQHGPFLEKHLPLYSNFNRPYIVTISHSQIKAMSPKVNHIGTVYNGLNMEHYPVSRGHDGYLLFVGRISHEKGVHKAIEVAKKAKLPLIIAAKLDDCDVPYYKKYIKPNLDSRVRWIGEVSESKRNELMSRALCLIHAIEWEEPFGLTLIEAMACGCPVVAIGKGAIPEIVLHGQTGFVAKNTNEMVDYVKRVDSIDRAECRSHALLNFNSKKMAQGYIDVYREAIVRHQLLTTKEWATRSKSEIFTGTLDLERSKT